MDRLRDLVARLRAPDGCPWDREQGLSNLRSYLLEEAHEVAAAIDSGDWDELRSELGDLLFQTAFIGQLASEAGAFTLADAAASAYDKMVARHPHVFGESRLDSAAEVKRQWERQKAAERPERSLLDGVPPSLPALLAAFRLGQKAAGAGFDWSDEAAVLAKVDEEIDELREALASSAPAQAVEEEVGDLLFALASLCRHLRIDPEAALAGANRKFQRRFAGVERRLRERGKTLGDSGPEELEELWEEEKAGEG